MSIMNTKRITRSIFMILFIVFASFASKSWACVGMEEWYGGTRFHIIQPLGEFHEGYQHSMLEETVSFWHRYFKKSIKPEVIKSFFKDASATSLTDAQYADNAFVMAVKKDAAASKYLQACLVLQDATTDSWDYQRDDDGVAAAAKLLDELGDMPASLTYRVALLKMRMAAAQDNFVEVEKVWKEQGSKCSDKQLLKRMKGYYGGALFHQGNLSEAMAIFSELGDMTSMRWCVSKYVGLDGIKKIVAERNAQDQILYYALQDYANYYWSSTKDDTYYVNDPQDLQQTMADCLADGNRMKQFALEMSNKNDADKIVWISMVAWIELCNKNTVEAYRYAEEACKLKGDQAQKENAERIMMLARLRMAPTVYDEKTAMQLAADFQVLFDRAHTEMQHYNKEEHYECKEYYYTCPAICPNYCFLLDTYHMELQTYFSNQNMTQAKVVAYNMCDQLQALFYDGSPSKWSQMWFQALNVEASLEDVAAFCEAKKSKKATDAFAQQLIKKFDADVMVLNDLVGTKLLREGKYGLALGYFKSLSNEYLLSTNYRPYIETREMKLEPMFERTQHNDVYDVELPAVPVNVKAQFCEDMVERINTLATLSGEAKAKLEVDMALRMFQASNAGDLWAISEFGVSSYGFMPNKLCAQARVQLNNAIHDCETEETRFNAYYGLALVPVGESFWSLEYNWEDRDMHYKFTMFHPSRVAYDYLVSHRNVRDLTQTCDVLSHYAKQPF